MVVKINIKMKETVARYRVLYTSRVMWIPPFLGYSDLTYQPESESLDFISVAFAWNYQVLRMYHSRVMSRTNNY